MPAGATRRFEVTVQGGPAVTGGVNVSSSGVASSGERGRFDPLTGDLRRVAGELAHSRPKAFDGNRATFRFSWTAPPYRGPVTLYAAGNSSNGRLNLLGDGIGRATLRLQVEGGRAPPPAPPTDTLSDVRLQRIAAGLDRPVAVRHAGDGRLFVVEQRGRIRIIGPNGTVLPRPLLNIEDRVDDTGNEQGLLGLAFHPDFARNRFFYVYYTRDGGSGPDRSRVSRFRVSADDRNRAWPATEQVLLEFAQPHPNHNGGDLHFGPDGHLYIASGDGGGAGDPGNNAQNPRSLLGKILRIDVDGRGGSPDCNLLGGHRYGIPADNAWRDGPGGAGCDEVFALGLRNPWRIGFDRETGALWIADVGQSAAEEVNRIRAGTPAGLNLGWRCFEGDRPYRTGGCTASYYDPLYVAPHGDGFCSITGGFVYRGALIPSLRGRYLWSDFCNTSLNALTLGQSGARSDPVLPAGHIAQPVSFGEDVHGELLVASLTGEIYRIRGSGAGSRVVGESGTRWIAQSGAAQWHRVTFSRRYTNPVVVLGPPSRNGGDPLTVRVRNVTGSGFELQLDEWDYLDGAHATERVGWLVVEQGSHRLADGRLLRAGRSSANHAWRYVGFGGSFAGWPVVLAQTASYRGTRAVTERLRNVQRWGFDVRLQEQEASDGSHVAEALHWIALEPGAAAAIEAGRLAGVTTPVGAVVGLAQWHSSAPVVLGSIQGFRGSDPVALRSPTRSGSSIELVPEEEQSADAETGHVGEPVGYVILTPGLLR